MTKLGLRLGFRRRNDGNHFQYGQDWNGPGHEPKSCIWVHFVHI